MNYHVLLTWNFFCSNASHMDKISHITCDLILPPVLWQKQAFKKKKKIGVQGEIIHQPGGTDTSKLCLAKLLYLINVCIKFWYNWSKPVGVLDAKLLVFFTQTDTQNLWLLAFSPFQTLFSKAFFSRGVKSQKLSFPEVWKVWIVWLMGCKTRTF